MAVHVRRIGPDDGEAFRATRLAALADTPSAFGSTLAAEEARPIGDWHADAERRATGDDEATFLAVDGPQVVGLVGAFRRGEVVDLVSMWVAPERRRERIGRTLIVAVVDWARGAGASAIELWVTVGNDGARAMYERAGFEPLDDFQPLPSDPCKDEQRMRLVVV